MVAPWRVARRYRVGTRRLGPKQLNAVRRAYPLVSMNPEARRAWAEHYAERIEAELERDDWPTVLALLEAIVGEPSLSRPVQAPRSCSRSEHPAPSPPLPPALRPSPLR